MKFFFLVFLSGLISVDRNSAFNVMISRPIIISIVLGLLLGEIQYCLLIGIIFELMGLIDLPVGTHVPRDDSFMSYAGCLMISFNVVDSIFKFAVILILLIVTSFPVTFTDTLTRRLNQSIFLRNKKKGYRFPVSRVLAWGVFISFFRGVIVYNFLFFLIYFIYNQIVAMDFKYTFSTDVTHFAILLTCFLIGYLIRFLSFKSVIKYIVFITGVILGWLLV